MSSGVKPGDFYKLKPGHIYQAHIQIDCAANLRIKPPHFTWIFDAKYIFKYRKIQRPRPKMLVCDWVIEKIYDEWGTNKRNCRPRIYLPNNKYSTKIPWLNDKNKVTYKSLIELNDVRSAKLERYIDHKILELL